MKTKINLTQFVKRNDKRFLIKLWKELRRETMLSGMPFGGAYIDARLRGDVIDKFYLLFDEALGEKYPELKGKNEREL